MLWAQHFVQDSNTLKLNDWLRLASMFHRFELSFERLDLCVLMLLFGAVPQLDVWYLPLRSFMLCWQHARYFRAVDASGIAGWH